MTVDIRRTEGAEPSTSDWTSVVLRFWFEEVGERGWYGAGARLDPLIRERFSTLHDAVATRTLQPRATDAKEILAAVIVLDQFSRHLFRGTARAYDSDALARSYTRMGLDGALDTTLSSAERMFLYMPLQHSESIADQADAVQLFSSLGNEEWTHYAVEHRAVIERFGRFPHRNAVLGRASTPAELDAIAAGLGTSW